MSPSTPRLSNKHDEGIWDLKDLETSENQAMKPSQWGAIGPKMYKALAPTHSKLPSGAYEVTLDRNDDRVIFIQKEVKTDDIIGFKDSISDKILKEIKSFWGKANKFKEAGFLHRRGYLLYGPQGTGKSSLVQEIISDVVERGGVVLICDNPKFFNIGLSTFRGAEPNRNMVCIFEDIDAIIKRYGEDLLLSVLDGSNMVDRVLNIGTTNYPEHLDKRIVSRPRRFDRVIKISAPNKKIRKEFLAKKLPKGEDVEKWVRMTEGLSFAGMTEAIISVTCLGNKFEDTIKILTDLENGHPSSGDFGTKVPLGFDGPERFEDDEEF